MKKDELKRMLYEKAMETVKSIDNAAFFKTAHEYDPESIDFYFENNKKGRMYLCSCYIWKEKAHCDVRIFKEM